MLNHYLPFNKQYTLGPISGDIVITKIDEFHLKTIDDKKQAFTAKVEGVASIKVEPLGEFETQLNAVEGTIEVLKIYADGKPEEVKVTITDFSEKTHKARVDEHIMKGASLVITEEINKKLKK